MQFHPASRANKGKSRRHFLKASLAVGAVGALQQIPDVGAAAQPRKPVMEEHDPKNIKLAHRVPSDASDDEMLFLQQIGLRWARVELQPAESDFDALSRVQKRFERFGMRIFSAMHPAYRSVRIQLGQKGREQDIEQYQTFLRNLGRLNIPVANHDFGLAIDREHRQGLDSFLRLRVLLARRLLDPFQNKK